MGTLAGTSEDAFQKSSIKVSNASGYLCHITSEAILPCPPETVFAILSNPDNSSVFRDIKSMGLRRIVSEEPAGCRTVEVEQQGEVKIMFRRSFFSTHLTVVEDSRDPAALKTSFTLIRSDVLSKFQGTWTLYPGPQAEGGEQAFTTKAVLEQDVLPAGVPPAMRHIPILGSILRGICVRAVRRLLEDLHTVIHKTNSGMSLDEVLGSGKRPSEADARLGSHAINDLSDSDQES